jgi:flagellar hook assembly protein FlgD
VGPNPAWQQVGLEYRLGFAGNVRVAVFDVAGHRVAEVQNGWQEAGVRQAIWTGQTENARRATPGTYFVPVMLNGHEIGTRRVALLH